MKTHDQKIKVALRKIEQKQKTEADAEKKKKQNEKKEVVRLQKWFTTPGGRTTIRVIQHVCHGRLYLLTEKPACSIHQEHCIYLSGTKFYENWDEGTNKEVKRERGPEEILHYFCKKDNVKAEIVIDLIKQKAVELATAQKLC